MKRFFVLFPLFLAFAFVQGCGGPERPKDLPTLYPCSITVTQAGAPLEGALVMLVPKGGSLAWNVEGTTNASGVAEIKTGRDFKGAPQGEYTVRISKIVKTPSALPEVAPKDSVEYEKWFNAIKAEVRPTYRMVKEEFDDVKKTPHAITIAEGKNEATFDVGEAIKDEINPKKPQATLSDSMYD